MHPRSKGRKSGGEIPPPPPTLPTEILDAVGESSVNVWQKRGGIRKFTVKSCANGSKVTHFRFIEGEVPFELKELGALANGESSVERERERRIN